MVAPRRRLAARRRQHGLTQEDLAHLLAVDRSTVARWESGETEPQPWARRKLARVLGLSLLQLTALLEDRSAAADDVAPAAASGSARSLSDPAIITHELADLAARYELTPSAALLTEAGRCYAAILSQLDAAGSDSRRAPLHTMAARAASLLSQLVWDASGRRDVDGVLTYCRAAREHAVEAGDDLAAAEVALRETFVALYSVGQQPDPQQALLHAAVARSHSAGRSPALHGVVELHAAEALAMQGEFRRCEAALDLAADRFGGIGSDDLSADSFSPSLHARLAGSCYLALGVPERAQPLLEACAVDLVDRPKTRSLVLGNLALAALRQRQLDAACLWLHEAADLLAVNRGGGGMSVVFAAARELYPWRQEQLVQDVHDRLLGLIARG